MKITLEQEGHLKYFTVLKILSSITEPKIKPFCDLRNRELELFAIFLYLHNEKYKNIPEAERSRIIFSYETRVEMGKMLGNSSLDVVYYLMSQLRKAKLISKSEIEKKYILPNLESFILNFK